jgi:hypothetical protein
MRIHDKTKSNGGTQPKDNPKNEKSGKSNAGNALDRTRIQDSDWPHGHQVYWQGQFKSLSALSVLTGESGSILIKKKGDDKKTIK